MRSGLIRHDETTTTRPRSRIATLVRVLTALAVIAVALIVPASAAPAAGATLTITPITWNVIGLDSNAPATSGPDTFPVGARICNTGSGTATALASSFVFDSTNAAIALVGPSSLTLGDLAAGACTDAYYNVVVTRSAASFDQTRRYRITASAADAATVATPTNRELYVEKLVSQNRNAVTGLSGSAIQTAPTSSTPGKATVVVGRTYTFVVDSKTATGGYEQLESFLNFPTTIFQVLSVQATYAQPTGATNDKVYANACGWDDVIGATPPGGTYRSCKGPAQYTGGKAGGSPIKTTYTVKVIAAGNGSLGTLIYDFSGSSYHYNSDFGADVTSVDFVAVNPPDLAMSKSHTGDFTRGANGSYTLSVTNVGGGPATGTTTVTDVLPAGLSFVGATGTGWTCGGAAGTVTCTTTSAIAAGATAPPITLTVLPTSGGTITNTASVANTDDTNVANDSASDPTLVDLLPKAEPDSRTTDEDTPVTVSVVTNDDLGDTPTTVTANTQGTRGTVSCTTTACTYTPAGDTNGSDTFTYTITDTDGDTSTATVTVTVAPINDPPVADDDVDTTVAGTPVTVPVLTNDDDVEHDTLVITTPAPTASHGTVTCSTTTCTYTPNAGHEGPDTFSYTISDGHGGTDSATVTITTGPAPVDLEMTKSHTGAFAEGEDGTYTLSVANKGGSPSAGTTTVTDVLPAGLSFVSAGGTGWSCSHATGTVTCTTTSAIAKGATAPAITLVVRPTAGGSVTNTAKVANAGDGNTANDSDGDTTTVDARPDADDDTASTDEDTPVTIPVLADDDLGDAPTTVTANTQGVHGAVACTTTGCTYTPDPDTHGSDTFTYTITDADGDTSTATVTVTVTPVDDPPAADDDTATTAAGTPVTVDVLTNDDDVEGDTLTITTPAPAAAHGTVTCTATTCTYTPAAGHEGPDTFIYAISDGHGGTDTATVTITTAAAGPGPVKVADPTPTTPTSTPPGTTPGATPPMTMPDLPAVAATTGVAPTTPAAVAEADAPAPAPAPVAPPAPAQAAAAAAERASAPELPRTGGSTTALALVAALLVLVGLLLRGAAGRRHPQGEEARRPRA